MSLTQILPWLLTAIVASVSCMVAGVHSGSAWLSWAAALIFTLSLLATSFDINRGWWEPGAARLDPDSAQLVALRNSQLITVAYMWGALALLAVYRLSGIRWQHGLQYGGGMALITFLLMVYTHFLARRGSALAMPRALSISVLVAWGHAGACLAGLSFLVLSGKLLSSKGDWAANQVFLAGGIAMMVLSAMAGFTLQRVTGAGSTPDRMIDATPAR